MDEARIQNLRRIVAERLAGNDPAHDHLHVLRVERLAREIAQHEKASVEVVAVAALCHELFNHPKDHPDSARSGEVCAEHARSLLRELSFEEAVVDPSCEAIRVHSFSAGLPAETLEAKVLQDADRLDAIGAIGVARCFSTSASMRRPFYSTSDAFCVQRPADDKSFALDHFYKKLLLIPQRLHTAHARELARPRVDFMNRFLESLREELRGTVLEPLPHPMRTAGMPMPVSPKK